ncbi:MULTISPECIES: aromatic acid exporter family protein [unclassified Streptomyces]|uniref:aromatic acid exporter family protein n=1 Tax=unclassified Streptomyces TaxID=2593676 RepID=UPI00224EBD78|nr:MULTISPECIES: aromatic acid exporter family protein [unclassified Streptomyces]MCX5329555.1 aromatic acid exporter family protein [Streptomyces sp. NBC_00140]MCX5358971.1 aromatic acid exporter family protein [Streptomyces sp. NBC_00124]
MRDVREWTASLVRFVKRRRDPVVVQTLRSAAAATIAYVIALRLSPEAAPLTAPLTALLVVQVTLYATLTNGIRRVNAVVAGVLVAIAFSLLVGLTWWSLALLILASLGVGHLVKVDEYVPEVAISAMLVLGVTTVGDTAWARVLETLIGAVVGLGFNLLLAPPVWVDEAGESIEGLARRVRQLMLSMGEEAAGRTPVEHATERLHEARRLDHDIVEVDAALKQAEDSLRLNPRVREGLLHRVVLRTGLDTLEICTVVLRVLARTLTDLAKERESERLFARQAGAAVEQLLSEIGDAVVSFAVLVTADVSRSAESAEERLASQLRHAAATRDKLAQLLLEEVQRDARQWQLHGAVLTEVNRILDELDTEHRSHRLLEELDRTSREQRERMPRLTRLQERLRRNRPALARRSR